MVEPLRQRRLRILFPYLILPSFMRGDIEALRSRHTVALVPCGSALGFMRCLARVLWADCLFCWFGSLRFLPLALLARALGKKVVIITAGYDVASVPEMSYGTMFRSPHKYLARLLLRLANRVAGISASNVREAQTNGGVAPNKIDLIYLGVDPGFRRKADCQAAKESLILTLGDVNMTTLHRKGLLAVAQVSHLLPDVRFVIAGACSEEAVGVLRDMAGPNVTFTGHVSDTDLHDLFARAKVYVQPSLHEAFGMAVAEAMLYDCTPVVSDRFALPEVVGTSGLYVDPNDVPSMAATLRRALDPALQLPESPRERILAQFPLSKRNDLLLELVERACLRSVAQAEGSSLSGLARQAALGESSCGAQQPVT